MFLNNPFKLLFIFIVYNIITISSSILLFFIFSCYFIILTKSLNIKYGWNAYLSPLEFTPLGLLEPCSCRAIKCATAKAANKKGSK